VVVKPFSASRQLGFHQLLVAARKSWLMDALSSALNRADPAVVKKELSDYVPPEAQKLLARAGIRDEHVFPVPVVLRERPTLIGYYRLLLGIPQKSFYASATGMSALKRMEVAGLLTKRAELLLPEFCRVMSVSLSELIGQISPQIERRDVMELPLLTIGSQFQGANNNLIGKIAMRSIFLVIAEIVKGHVIDQSERKLIVKNSAGREVAILLGTDPDVAIRETFGKDVRNRVALEIKGGTDNSNVHNRVGEAEKSHQKARKTGYRDFWTIIGTRGIDMQKLRSESPTTNSWFDIAQVASRSGKDWIEFRTRVCGEVGIP
jgi:hypothetical protein